MIVDSSVWIGFLCSDPTAEVKQLKNALEARRPIWLVPVILQEVLQGADSERTFTRWARVLSGVSVIRVSDPAATARAAALLYAKCRWRGITPRSANDCLIAASAVEVGLPLLHRDRDFDRMVIVEPRLRIVPPA